MLILQSATEVFTRRSVSQTNQLYDACVPALNLGGKKRKRRCCSFQEAWLTPLLRLLLLLLLLLLSLLSSSDFVAVANETHFASSTS